MYQNHSITVSLVRNLNTNRISPQYHVVFDDNFETVRSDEDNQPLIWEELVTFNTLKSNYDDYKYLPELIKEWLDED